MNLGIKKPTTLFEWVRLGTTTIALAQAGRAGVASFGQWRQCRVDSRLYSISLEESNDPWLYRQISRWVMDQIPPSTRKSIVAEDFNSQLRERPPEGNMALTVYVGGIPIRFWWHETGGEEADLGGLTIQLKKATQLLTMICPDLAARDSVIRFLEEKFIVPAEKIRRVYRSRKMGGWGWVRNMSQRGPDTLILPEGMYDDLYSDIHRFMDSESKYLDRGIPWHRGILFYGPPGTGKSSTISTLAAAFDKDVYFMSLSELSDNAALADCVSAVGTSGFLVLEDVDIVRASHEREAGTEGVSLDGLLNVLDGVLTPDGLISFMTTNHLEELDSALIRPGRADRQYELGYMTQEQLDRMVERFVGPGETVLLGRDNVVPAEIVECLKSSFDQPADYVLDCIREVVSEGFEATYVPRKVEMGKARILDETEAEAVPE